MIPVVTPCEACGKPVVLDAQGEPLYSIHRDGFLEGPEVPLCANCGAHETPDCDWLWALIRRRRRANGANGDNGDKQ